MTLAPDVGAARAVTRASSLRGRLRLPSDKSVAHRALIVGAMAAGGSVVTLDRPGADVRSTLGAVERHDRPAGRHRAEDKGAMRDGLVRRQPERAPKRAGSRDGSSGIDLRGEGHGLAPLAATGDTTGLAASSAA